ncbi:GNAT family N-acetyltransferase [Reichenbachiella ulvae]|uniref:GNAT family N-acetyltransferase n=1 Tax=Reichenbachiella ulvae TaxID=2980104 RepID=A0ABT3CT43_9BACT|nr:GNAT family N-acetyltransferase [Reichenbachiella ulvae]MCV9386413.1 GNAT family N-acetyltransferase [Reichenbachiella ulvae]
MKLDFKAVKAEADQIVLRDLAYEIWNEFFPPIIGQSQVDYMLEKFSSLEAIKNQSQEGYQYYFIVLDGQNAGYLTFKISDEELFLSKLYLHANYRGKGIAKKAMRFLLDCATEQDVDNIRLTVNRDNVNSIAAYEKMGFEKVDEQITDIGQGYVMDDYIMRLFIR